MQSGVCGVHRQPSFVISELDIEFSLPENRKKILKQNSRFFHLLFILSRTLLLPTLLNDFVVFQKFVESISNYFDFSRMQNKVSFTSRKFNKIMYMQNFFNFCHQFLFLSLVPQHSKLTKEVSGVLGFVIHACQKKHYLLV